MSNIKETSSSNRWSQNMKFRMAYSINNHQPVICTSISDQPLFYMDYVPEDDFDPLMEDEFAGEEYINLESEYMHTDYNHVPAGSMFKDAPIEGTITEFLSDIADALAPNAPLDDNADIETLLTMMRKSRYASALLACAEDYKTTITYCDHVEHSEYDRDQKAIRINPNLSEHVHILLLAQELRRVWQHRQGAMIDPLNFHPDHAVLASRAQRADLSVAMVRIAWELQLSGNRVLWSFLQTSSMEDIARNFAREAHSDFRSINSGLASAAGFESWFLSDRPMQEDKILIQSMLSGYKGGIFADEKASFGVLSDMIVALGEQPFGKNYLSSYTYTITQDAIFTEVRDRSNANFLWFIKFEHSFKEAEHDLQRSDDNRHTDQRGGSINNKSDDGKTYHEETGQVIHLPVPARAKTAGRTKTIRSDRDARDGSGTANIIHFTQALFGRD